MEEVGHIYAVDNSNYKNNMELIDWLKNQSKISYLDLYLNQGLAKALNIGHHRAIEDGYDYAMTMDQDSFF